ncbi:hypothetical protein GIB67_037767 [Kingdonia uniflora]|uniref:Pentatricopeptide repeat-containing protein n=1 Tax=Kingdonia uniflora TaxID=39325 RepID=A0A7J7LV61_9MAGN|nr:hypothetical protein GIB67_037767 [Kingdonia uniflora]
MGSNHFYDDVWEPTRVSSNGGFHGFVIFISDSTRELGVHFLKNEIRWFDVFVRWKAWVEIETVSMLKRLESNSDGNQFCCDEFVIDKASIGIERLEKIPIILQEFGMAESVIREITERARKIVLEPLVENVQREPYVPLIIMKRRTKLTGIGEDYKVMSWAIGSLSWMMLRWDLNRHIRLETRVCLDMEYNMSLDRAYIKVGDLDSVQNIFNEMPVRDVISWTSLIEGYSQMDRFSESVKLFRKMMKAKVKSYDITVTSVLSVCAHLGSLDIGKAVHDYICGYNIHPNICVRNALIYMNFKCGSTKKALEVFKEMVEKDTVSWTSVITGLAINGYSIEAIDYFSRMLSKGVRPRDVTYIGVLQACVCAGLVDKGLEYFEEKFCFNPPNYGMDLPLAPIFLKIRH